MKFTRIVVVSFILMSGGLSDLQAQSLGRTAQPTEYPPASYKARQYVDSKGCVFIRAGIDGATNWVPRVDRARKQLCGFKPSNVAGATKTRPQAPGYEVITLSPQDQPAASSPPSQPKEAGTARPTASKPAAPAVAPAPKRAEPAANPKPVTAPTTAPKATVRASAPPKTVTKPRSAPATPPAVSAPTSTGGCPGASALSQQYISKRAKVRCGPQAEDPLGSLSPLGPTTPGEAVFGERIAQVSASNEVLTVPPGYRPVWTDGRLNPQRGPRRPIVPYVSQSTQGPAPQGFRYVEMADGRYNPMRGVGSPAGEAQMAQILTNTVPRRAVKRAPTAQEASNGFVMRLSTRSEPGTAPAVTPGRFVAAAPVVAPARYVRTAVLSDPAAAQRVAQALARKTGLPIRLGTVSRKGQTYRVVLAGPFTQGAEQALQQLQAAGYPGARLSK